MVFEGISSCSWFLVVTLTSTHFTVNFYFIYTDDVSFEKGTSFLAKANQVDLLENRFYCKLY